MTNQPGALSSMHFLYPKSRQFPFDEVCEQIVRALQARNWKVPGFTVEFHDYGSGAQKLRYVSSISSDPSAIDLFSPRKARLSCFSPNFPPKNHPSRSSPSKPGELGAPKVLGEAMVEILVPCG